MADTTIESIPKTIPDITQQHIEQLKQVFPECVTESKWTSSYSALRSARLTPWPVMTPTRSHRPARRRPIVLFRRRAARVWRLTLKNR